MTWKRGPLPPGTYNWGGVVPAGLAGGFYFADFYGDYVVANPGSTAATRYEAHQVLWYDNSIGVPPDMMGRGAGNARDTGEARTGEPPPNTEGK